MATKTCTRALVVALPSPATLARSNSAPRPLLNFVKGIGRDAGNARTLFNVDLDGSEWGGVSVVRLAATMDLQGIRTAVRFLF